MTNTPYYFLLRVAEKKPTVDFVKEQLDFNRIRYGPDLPLACEYERPEIKVANPEKMRMNHQIMGALESIEAVNHDFEEDYEMLQKLKIEHKDMDIYLWIPRFMFEERVSELANRADFYANQDMESNKSIIDYFNDYLS